MREKSSNLNRTNDYLWLPVKKRKAKIPVENIIRLEAYSNYTKFYIKDQKDLIIVSKTLKHYQNKLIDQQFIRPHQSHLINAAYIANYSIQNGSHLILEDDTKIEISRRKKGDVLSCLENISIKL